MLVLVHIRPVNRRDVAKHDLGNVGLVVPMKLWPFSGLAEPHRQRRIDTHCLEIIAHGGLLPACGVEVVNAHAIFLTARLFWFFVSWWRFRIRRDTSDRCKVSRRCAAVSSAPPATIVGRHGSCIRLLSLASAPVAFCFADCCGVGSEHTSPVAGTKCVRPADRRRGWDITTPPDRLRFDCAGTGLGCRSVAVASLSMRPSGTASHDLVATCARLHLSRGASCVGKASGAV